MNVDWYVRRARRMSAAELASRTVDHGRRLAWRHRQARPGETPTPIGSNVLRERPVAVPCGTATVIPERARLALIETADQLLRGRWSVLGVDRRDLCSPDWFRDPISGRLAPRTQYAFRINYRSEQETGNVKQVWELSRHQHLTVLAAAWYCTGDDRYAEMVERHLKSWWRGNPFLSGVHWTSGIELGLRLVSWAWIRRLLDG